MSLQFLGLLPIRTRSQHENDAMYAEFREEDFNHKQIVKFHHGSSEIAV